MTTAFLLVLALASAGSAAEDSARPVRTHHAPTARKGVERQSFMRIDSDQDWKTWISTHYPDDSASWPAGCQAGPPKGDQAWEAKGDFTKDGRPSALTVETKDLGEKGLMVTRLSVWSCSSGRWEERLCLDGEAGISIDGVKMSALSLPQVRGYSMVLSTGLKAFPAMRVSATGLDDQGEGLTEAVHLFYMSKKRKYEVFAN